MKTIGVRLDVDPSDNLLGQIKQELLLFDKIGVVDLSIHLDSYQQVNKKLNNYTYEIAILLALKNNNHLFEISYQDLYDRSQNKDFGVYEASLESLASDLKTTYSKRTYIAWLTYISILMKFLDGRNGTDYIALIDRIFTEQSENTFKSNRSALVTVVIEKDAST